MIDLRELDVAVSVLSFNRPVYLKTVINSLEDCVDKEMVDWILMQDGAVNKFSGIRRAEDHTIERSTEILKEADLPNKEIRVNDHNLCTAIMYDKQFKLIKEDYDVVIRIEGDIELSKYFIRVYMSLLDEYPNTVPTVYSEGPIYEKDPDEDINKVQLRYKNASFCTAAMTNDIYWEIEDEWDKFRDIIYQTDWWVGQRPQDVIWNMYGDDIPAACDGVLQSILESHKIKRVNPLISRGSHIGKAGLNLSPQNYDERFGQEGELEYEWDKNPGKINKWESIR